MGETDGLIALWSDLDHILTLAFTFLPIMIFQILYWRFMKYLSVILLNTMKHAAKAIPKAYPPMI